MNHVRFTRTVATGAVLVLLCFALAGCAVNQEKEVALWRSVLDHGTPKEAPAYAVDEPLTLQKAMALANANNEQLALAGEDYLQALIAKDRAYSNFLPTISFAPSFVAQDTSKYGSDFVPPSALDVAGEASMDLHPGRDIPATQAARATAEQKKAELLDRQSLVLLDVAKTYFQILTSERQAKVFEHSEKVQEKRVADMQTRYDAGAAPLVDLSQAKAQLAQTRVSLDRAANDARNGRAMLAVLLGVSSVQGPLSDRLDVPKAVWTPDELLYLAYDNRQDLQAAHARVEASAKRLDAAWGEYYPSVSLNLTNYFSRQSFPDDVSWTSLIGVNLPIFNAGITHQNVRQAYSLLRQAHTVESRTRREVLRDLRVALDDLSSDERQLKDLAEQVNAADLALDQSESAYTAGAGTGLQRLVAQDVQLVAMLDLTRQTYQHDVDYLRLLRAVGLLDPSITATLPVAEQKAAATAPAATRPGDAS
ncbi:outer membrane efflux protein [Desulfovibrio sp. X2]|uniref:TolC family protein n=1 Tax=Desulfovibrio sp. X2 TaxID=941449 RepID=UPI000358C5FB|nr:TolC family protein [Desulfovibrio sp. X2]EPR37358.1 outer membrane efflux protein [Desulfovibrio sp. X2]